MESTLVSKEDILTMAKQISRKRLSKGRSLTSPAEVKAHIRTLLQDYECEVFSVLLVDIKHKILGFHELFRGTLSSTTVHPRELVKLALEHTPLP